MTDRPEPPELGPEFERADPLNWQPGPVYGTPGTGPGYEQAVTPKPTDEPPRPQFQAYQQPRYQAQYQPPQYQSPQYQSPQYQSPQYAVAYPTYVQVSDKSRSAAGLLELLPSFFGICGIGRLYLGHTSTGLIQLLGMLIAMVLSAIIIGLPFMVAIWIWNLVDAIRMFSGSITDSNGLPLRG